MPAQVLVQLARDLQNLLLRNAVLFVFFGGFNAVSFVGLRVLGFGHLDDDLEQLDLPLVSLFTPAGVLGEIVDGLGVEVLRQGLDGPRKLADEFLSIFVHAIKNYKLN